MNSTDAFMMLLEEETGTYLLRENSNNELRLSVRSKLPRTEENAINNVKLVGHIALRKDESGGWLAGSGRHDRYDNFYDIIKANKDKDSIYTFKSYYKS